MNLTEVILYVQDMDKMVKYYRDVIGLALKYPSGLESYSEEYWVVFDTGPCALALHGGGTTGCCDKCPKIVFRVSGIESKREELLGKGVDVDQIRSPAAGILVCDGTDVEGNQFSLEEVRDG